MKTTRRDNFIGMLIVAVIVGFYFPPAAGLVVVLYFASQAYHNWRGDRMERQQQDITDRAHKRYFN